MCGFVSSTAAPLLQYLRDLECPLEHTSRNACREEALDWLLRHAVSLEYADSFCASGAAGAALFDFTAAYLVQSQCLHC